MFTMIFSVRNLQVKFMELVGKGNPNGGRFQSLSNWICRMTLGLGFLYIGDEVLLSAFTIGMKSIIVSKKPRRFYMIESTMISG